MKVIISSGMGKLHFHETARAAALAGVDVEFIAGWVPSEKHSRQWDAFGRLIGEASLAKRMQARIVDHPRVQMRSNALAEFGGRAITTVLRRFASDGNLGGLAFGITGMGSRK